MKSHLINVCQLFCLCSINVLMLSAELTAQESSYDKVLKEVNNVRTEYEKNIGRKIPSMNVLIQTPADYIFVSSVPEGNIGKSIA